MKRIFSGIQPTGHLHLGNYLGAIRNWVKLQHEYESLFCIVDLHSITLPQDPILLRQSITETAAAYIASGIDPAHAAIFVQSDVPAHSELSWILSCITQVGWLNRMIQFKEKAGHDKEQASLGLYSYPVLMAADILIYKSDLVPVGEDQTQHLELTRDIAGAFNRHVGREYFTLPEMFSSKTCARIMSLRDGTKKMSKSDISDYSRINLSDDADTIAKKFQKAKSDSFNYLSYEPETRPEAANLINIYSALSDLTIDQIINQFQGHGFAQFKKALTELAVTKLSPITETIRELNANRDYINTILKTGGEKAHDIANQHLREVKELIGLFNA